MEIFFKVRPIVFFTRMIYTWFIIKEVGMGKRFSVSIPLTLYRELMEYVRGRADGASLAQVVREALVAYIKGGE